MDKPPTIVKKILIVEDDQYLRDLYVEILEDEGFYVENAADGEEGYKKIFHGGYDLVLLDIMLPTMNGLTILEKIKNETLPMHPNGMIVVLSNLGQETTVAKAIALGARGYMIKSDYTPAQVISKIKEFLASAPTAD
jgi:DNA-binding response OmpR family regulator